ncbi:MBL fold metallo-hydrolase [Halovenus sp. WSH3]|uniref:MBL fold metallo-hydrolase n=1 Tax=Halovenus carboxidivorans TaxID=2692199 RepID=A0A6B0TAQ3_9EURY|nr:MBL fold metallo-hydrolase [Halovenus carboxidivorans]MXR52482.1 MBL fold metallo-hydrolase [Halovenus carboxidivorans]
MDSPSTSQSQTEIHRIEIGVDWPPGHVAAYLIDADEPILVDAGMDGEESATEFEAGLSEAGYTLADIDHLVLTHPHVDHIGQVNAVREAGSPTVYAPVGARARLSRDVDDLGATVRRHASRAGLRGEMLDTVVEQSVNSLERNRTLLDPDTVDVWIEDGDEVPVGGVTFRAIHTPGHQADHLCYDVDIDGEQILFSGDILLEPFRSVMIHTGLDTGVEDAVEAFFTALDRLDSLGPRRVFPGHGPTHDRLHETATRSRENIEEMLAGARAVVADGGTTVLELAQKRSGDRNFHYVLPEVYSALSHLEAEGEVQSRVEDGISYYFVD